MADKPEWWTTVPAPKAKCPGISADELMKMFDDMDIKPVPRQFLLVDVRRNDWEVSDPSEASEMFEGDCNINIALI